MMVECAVCGVKDARMLAVVQLRGGEEATLCGSHALMHARSKADIRTEADLREHFADRRSGTRRVSNSSAVGGDELVGVVQPGQVEIAPYRGREGLLLLRAQIL